MTDAEEQQEQQEDLATVARGIVARLRDDEKTDLVELLAASFTGGTFQANLPVPVAVPELSPAHLEALNRLPEVFGKVKVTEPRLLTDDEIVALVEERGTIDLLLGVLKKRKEETLRDNLANHLDRLAEEKGLEDTPTNADGHYLVRQDVPVPGTGMKVQGIVSTPKAVVDSARLEALHEEGVISREEYLAITSTPPVKRVFDVHKARKAALKNPDLLTRIAMATRKPQQTLTIKVVKDS